MNEYVVFCTTGCLGKNSDWIGEPPWDCIGVRRCFGSDPVEAINTILVRKFDEMPNAKVLKTDDDAVVHLAAILPPNDFWVTVVRVGKQREVSMKEALQEILASGSFEHVLHVSDPDNGDTFEFGPENVLRTRLQEVCDGFQSSESRFSDCGCDLLTAGEALSRLDFETLNGSPFGVRFH